MNYSAGNILVQKMITLVQRTTFGGTGQFASRALLLVLLLALNRFDTVVSLPSSIKIGKSWTISINMTSIANSKYTEVTPS